jgi:hypothetical protein
LFNCLSQPLATLHHPVPATAVQLNVTVPWEIAGRLATNVVVEYQQRSVGARQRARERCGSRHLYRGFDRAAPPASYRAWVASPTRLPVWEPERILSTLEMEVKR